jgi:hypothetical protein
MVERLLRQQSQTRWTLTYIRLQTHCLYYKDSIERIAYLFFFNEILDVNKGKSLSQIFICSTLLLSEGAASSSANKPVPRP